MKLLVFAHTPPPHHGQSYMVQLMLGGFGGDRRKTASGHALKNGFGIDCYQVNARFSRTLEDVGEFQGWKIFLIFFYCLQAIWCRYRYGIDNFYYVPAASCVLASRFSLRRFRLPAVTHRSCGCFFWRIAYGRKACLTPWREWC